MERRLSEMETAVATTLQSLQSTTENLENHSHPNLEDRLEGHGTAIGELRQELADTENRVTAVLAETLDQLQTAAQDEPGKAAATVIETPAQVAAAAVEKPRPRHSIL